jgi:type IV secretory pathway VirB6-like protein
MAVLEKLAGLWGGIHASGLGQDAVIEIMVALLGLMVAVLAVIAGLFAVTVALAGVYGFKTLIDEATKMASEVATTVAGSLAREIAEREASSVAKEIADKAMAEMSSRAQATGMTDSQVDKDALPTRAPKMRSGRTKATTDKGLREG